MSLTHLTDQFSLLKSLTDRYYSGCFHSFVCYCYGAAQLAQVLEYRPLIGPNQFALGEYSSLIGVDYQCPSLIGWLQLCWTTADAAYLFWEGGGAEVREGERWW